MPASCIYQEGVIGLGDVGIDCTCFKGWPLCHAFRGILWEEYRTFTGNPAVFIFSHTWKYGRGYKPKVMELKAGHYSSARFAESDNHFREFFYHPHLQGDGGQAELTRVPLADGTLFAVPGSDFSDETLASLLTLSDVLGTGYHAAVSAGVKPGDTVAVVGDGAVGLSAVLSASLLGAQRIIALSRHRQRQALAREFGATDVLAERGDAAVKAILGLTDGIGVDAVLECVGTNEANQTAFTIARPGAIVGRVGMPHNVEIPAEGTFS